MAVGPATVGRVSAGLLSSTRSRPNSPHAAPAVLVSTSGAAPFNIEFVTMTVKPVTIGPFSLGVNNRVPDTDLKVRGGPGVTNGYFIRAAVNADLSKSGKLRRRDGYTQLVAGAGSHSAWGHEEEDFGFY